MASHSVVLLISRELLFREVHGSPEEYDASAPFAPVSPKNRSPLSVYDPRLKRPRFVPTAIRLTLRFAGKSKFNGAAV